MTAMPAQPAPDVTDAPQPAAPRTGARLLVKTLEGLGVEVIFGYPGGAIMPVYDALPGSALKHILVRHEQGAAFAADAYGRMTGRAGVCMATSGPGATNLITGIANAYMDSVPMVAITGQVASGLMGTDAFQEIDIFGLTLPVVKHSVILRDPAEIPEKVAEAFRIAESGRPGPVLIDLPKDVAQAEAKHDRANAAAVRADQPVQQRLADARAALAHLQDLADEPGDLPCFPVAVRNGRRFPWSIALQFAAARDLATLARTHRAARAVCRHEQTAKRVLKARHGRGCKRAKDTKCACGGCARVALLLRAADTLGECGAGPSRWLRVLDYTEGAAAGRLPVRRFGVTGESGEGNHQFKSPMGVCVEPGIDGLVYVADRLNHRVQVLTKEGQYVRTLGVTEQEGGGNHQLSAPRGVCVEPGPSGLVYVSGMRNHRVQVLTKEGQYVRTLGVTGQHGRGNHQFSTPNVVCVEPGPRGRVFVADTMNHRVQVLKKDGTHLRTIGVAGQRGSGIHQFKAPYAVAVEPGPVGPLLYAADVANNRVLVFLSQK